MLPLSCDDDDGDDGVCDDDDAMMTMGPGDPGQAMMMMTRCHDGVDDGSDDGDTMMVVYAMA